MSRTSLRLTIVLGGLVAMALFAPPVRVVLQADVTTRQKVTTKFEGMMGRLAGMAGGAASKDGMTSTLAVTGTRKASRTDNTGQIIDLAEERVYEVDYKKKEYRVTTFAEMRERMKKAQEDLQKSMKDMPDQDRNELDESGKEIEISVDVKETGQTKSIAGHTARQMVVTLTAHEKGKTLEEGGGMVMTNDTWMGPKVAALDEIWQFDLKYFTAVYGDGLDAMAGQMTSAVAMYPNLKQLLAQMEDKVKAMDGTALMTTMTVETVRSAEAMAQASAAAPTGGGLRGALARRALGNRKVEPRSLLVTSTTETLSIDTSVNEADLAIPAGFKLKK